MRLSKFALALALTAMPILTAASSALAVSTPECQPDPGETPPPSCNGYDPNLAMQTMHPCSIGSAPGKAGQSGAMIELIGAGVIGVGLAMRLRRMRRS